ncbi:uncharacterized protein DSM5745_05758 [Aspergillus mulundensis]|uniref:MYND-type zinc finger protein samB n=1 Tax=Aspergillus mulundensis TaxID=1810919 RepID=A0A3D8RY14_9EURO|nr:hypothetical protein DSM5745_05758 [Aspergillus mulundensis]RDW78906.1 hypothetical protein DSM5745_05758 [Aspergillus mulundensis]
MITKSLFEKTRFPPYTNLPMKLASRVPVFKRLFSPTSTILDRYCFIAEILDVESRSSGPYHTILKARDYDDTTVTIACSFPKQEPMGLSAHQALLSAHEVLPDDQVPRRGMCVFILNAQTQKIQLEAATAEGDGAGNEVDDEVVGIVLEDVTRLKILGVNLKTLIALNNTICEFTSDRGGQRCFGCRQRRAPGSLDLCESCGFIGFCADNPDCERKGRGEQRHDGHCQVLEDRDMGRLLRGEWDDLDCFEWVVFRLPGDQDIYL